MSQERSYKTEIRIPNPPRAAWVQGRLSVEANPALDLLRQAAEEVTAESGGTLDGAYLDCTGKGHRAWLAVHTPAFARGIGLTVARDGRVDFRYDNATAINGDLPELAGQVRFIHDRPDTAKAVCGSIVSRYVTLAAQRALESLGCTVRVDEADAREATRAVVRGTDASGRERAVFVSPRGEVYVDFRGFRGEDCVAAEQALRERFALFGLALDTTWQRRKTAPAAASFGEPVRAEVVGE